ncbi:MAG: SpoIIE family protein phosphatase [Candidatus Poribacteria bacterium]|nr:SpoIIE family protein phosphatase [Candidatus Poribacteria bacterium]
MSSLIKFVLILILCLSIAFIESSIAFEQIETYTVADGLVGPIVPVIFQDSRGALWFGSDRGGVSRFDGRTFVPYTASPVTSEEMPTSVVQPGALLGRTRQIVEDKWGHIWFLTREDSEETGHVSRFDGTSIQLIGTGSCLSVDRAGDVWVSESQWLTQYITAGVQRLPEAHRNELESEDSLQSTETLTINVIFEGKDGTLWLGGSGGAKEKKAVILSFRETRPANNKTETQTSRIQPGIGITRYDTSNLNGVGAIEAITEDTAGHLWFGGYNFLLKFDGQTFEWILPLGSEQNGAGTDTSTTQASIQMDTKGRLWFSDGRISRWWDGSRLQTPENVSGVLKIEDAWENLWFTDENGEVHQYDAALALIPYSADGGFGIGRVRTIFEAINGDLWFGHDNGATVFNPKPAIQNHGTGIGGRVRGKSRFAFWTDIGKIFEIGEYIWFINKPIRSGNTIRYTFFRYGNGRFDEVSVFIKPDARHLGRRYVRNPNLFITEEEHPWIAFGGHIFKAHATGLFWLTNRFQRIPFQTTLEIDHAASPINALHTDTNKLWVLFENGRVQSYPKEIEPSTSLNIEPETLPYLIKVTKTLEIPSGTKWFFNAVTGKLIRWNDADPSKPIVLRENSRAAPLAVWQHPKEMYGKVSFLFPDALKTYLDKELIITKDIELASVNASLISREGVLWLATSRGAVRYDGTKLTSYASKNTSRNSRKEGFLVDDVRDVIEDSSRSIWFATKGGGTVRYDGETFDFLTTKDGLAHNNISKIYESSNKDIWFATEGGVTQYTPARGGLPFYRLTALKADKTYTELSSNITLPAYGNKHIIFYVRGLSPLRERLSYQFKIIGLDSPGWTKISAVEFARLPTGFGGPSDKWFPASGLATQQATHDDGVQQEFQNQNGVLCVRYTDLKAGTYSFIVKAFREDWPYTQPPAVVDFSISPPFWTRWRTYLPTVMFMGIVVALIGRLVITRRHTAQLRNEMQQKEEAEIKRIRAELDEAQNIQMGLLPTESPDTKGFDIAGMSAPATQVGGDFYDYLTLANGQTAIAVADAAGKGLRGAMNAVLTNGMLHEVARFESGADVILTALNAGLAPRMYGPSFIALNLAILNESEKRIDYANGGQPYPILKKGTEIIEIEDSDLPLGSMKSVRYESITFDLAEGDVLIFHSDGLIEALNADEEMYGAERLKAVTSRIPDEYTAEEVIQHIVEDVNRFVEEAEQYDDLTLVVIKRISGSE